jgi:ribosome-associated translation inhibitor RaiA
MITLIAGDVAKKVGKFFLAYLPHILAAAFILLPWALWFNVRSDYADAKKRLDAIDVAAAAQKEDLKAAVNTAEVKVKEVVKYQTKIERQVEKVYVRDKESRDWSAVAVPDAVCDSLSARYCKDSENTE